MLRHDVSAAGAAVTIAAGALAILGKLKRVLMKIEAIVDEVKAAAAGTGRAVLVKLNCGCPCGARPPAARAFDFASNSRTRALLGTTWAAKIWPMG